MLASCNNEAPDTDTDVGKDTDAIINTSTDTNLDGGKTDDLPKDDVGLTPTINNFEVTKETKYSYYESVGLGKYLGDDLSEKYGGNDYRVIKSYEELEKLVEYPTVVPKSLFENHMILVIQDAGSSSSILGMYGGFFDLSYNMETKILSINVHGKYPLDCTTDIAIRNHYLIVPRNEKIIDNVTSGKINLNNTNIEYNNYEYASFYDIDASKIEVGAVYICESLAKINEIINSFQLEIQETMYDCIDDNVAYILICERACTCKLGYKDFHFDGNIAYITQETLEHKESCKNASVYLDLRKVTFDGIGQKITKNTKVKVLVEKRVHLTMTQYFEKIQENDH